MKIEIKSLHVDKRDGSKEGRNYTIRNQFGYAYLPGKPYPTEIKISLENTQDPFPIGEYTLDESAFYTDKYQKLNVGRLVLTPIKAVRAA